MNSKLSQHQWRIQDELEERAEEAKLDPWENVELFRQHFPDFKIL